MGEEMARPGASLRWARRWRAMGEEMAIGEEMAMGEEIAQLLPLRWARRWRVPARAHSHMHRLCLAQRRCALGAVRA
jgi:hypothetical protein